MTDRIVPPPPAFLELPVSRSWKGGALPARRWAWVRLSASADALEVAMGMPHLEPPRLPPAPAGARVPDLWRYDVVECFLVAADGRYLEIELGPGGHYLVLAFDAPRRRSRDFAEETVAVTLTEEDEGWSAHCEIPRAWVPEPVVAGNAFAIVGGRHLVHESVGVGEPDFHRLDAFPEVRIPGWE